MKTLIFSWNWSLGCWILERRVSFAPDQKFHWSSLGWKRHCRCGKEFNFFIVFTTVDLHGVPLHQLAILPSARSFEVRKWRKSINVFFLSWRTISIKKLQNSDHHPQHRKRVIVNQHFIFYSQHCISLELGINIRRFIHKAEIEL